MTEQIKQGTNYVVVEGPLAEISIADRSYTRKDGVNVEAIGGIIKIRVTQDIDGVMKVMEVPVNLFAQKYTKQNTENGAYTDIMRLKSYNSIAVVGEAEATRVRVTGATLETNEYYSKAGLLVSFPRIKGSFVRVIKTEDCVERAVWEMDAFIGKMGYQINKEGLETAVFEIKGVNVGYMENTSVFSLITSNPEIIQGLNNNFNEGETVPFSGKLNFSSVVETILETVEIGEPVERTRTVNVSEIIITGAKSANPNGWSVEEISKLQAQRTAKLEEMKKQRDTTGSKNTMTAPSKKGIPDLGF